jgi:hypothetical protein
MQDKKGTVSLFVESDVKEINTRADSLGVKDKVREILVEVLREKWPSAEKDDLEEDEGELIPVDTEKSIAMDLKKKLDEKVKGNWNAIIGNRFSASVGISKSDFYVHYEYKTLNIIIFQSSIGL